MKNADMPAMPSQSATGGVHHKGITKREYFAGLAMQGYMASYAGIHQQPSKDHIAEFSVSLADALLSELERTK